MGLRTADEEDSAWLFSFEAFEDGWCALENRSVVARGMTMTVNDKKNSALCSRAAGPEPDCSSVM